MLASTCEVLQGAVGGRCRKQPGARHTCEAHEAVGRVLRSLSPLARFRTRWRALRRARNPTSSRVAGAGWRLALCAAAGAPETVARRRPLSEKRTAATALVWPWLSLLASVSTCSHSQGGRWSTAGHSRSHRHRRGGAAWPPSASMHRHAADGRPVAPKAKLLLYVDALLRASQRTCSARPGGRRSTEQGKLVAGRPRSALGRTCSPTLWSAMPAMRCGAREGAAAPAGSSAAAAARVVMLAT